MQAKSTKGDACGTSARSDSREQLELFDQPDFRISCFVGNSFAVVSSDRSCAVTDCIVYGRIAGRHAAREAPWS